MLTSRFDQALLFASNTHRLQQRKGTSVPYISHLLSVCALVLEHGGDEDQAITALLHDAAEDQGGQGALDLIGKHFGEKIMNFVSACSESPALKKAGWRVRKEAFIESLGKAPQECLAVVAADKVHNISCLNTDIRLIGPSVFERFSGGREGTCWYYAEMARVLSGRIPQGLELLMHDGLRALQSTT